MNLREKLSKNRFMRAVGSDEPPKTRGVSKWWGGKPIAGAAANVVARIRPAASSPPTLPRRSGPSLDRNQRAKAARLLETHNRQTRTKGSAGRTDQGALKGLLASLGAAEKQGCGERGGRQCARLRAHCIASGSDSRGIGVNHPLLDTSAVSPVTCPARRSRTVLMCAMTAA